MHSEESMVNKSFDNSKNQILSNVTKVVLNKAALQELLPCARVLGGHSNVIRAATLGLQNSDLFGLILAHLMITRTMGVGLDGKVTARKSTEQMEEFAAGASGFIEFMAQCAQEVTKYNEIAEQKSKSQQQGGVGPSSA